MKFGAMARLEPTPGIGHRYGVISMSDDKSECTVETWFLTPSYMMAERLATRLNSGEDYVKFYESVVEHNPDVHTTFKASMHYQNLTQIQDVRIDFHEYESGDVTVLAIERYPDAAKVEDFEKMASWLLNHQPFDSPGRLRLKVQIDGVWSERDIPLD